MVPSYRLIRVAFAATAKVGIIPLMNLAFPGYPQGAAGEFPHENRHCRFRPRIGLPAASTAFAQAAPADTKAIRDCLKKADDAGQLGNNCIGIVADPCVEKSDKMNARTKACAARELAVWTALTEGASKRVKAGGFKDISAAVAESDKGWMQLRDKLCPVFDKIETRLFAGRWHLLSNAGHRASRAAAAPPRRRRERALKS